MAKNIEAGLDYSSRARVSGMEGISLVFLEGASLEPFLQLETYSMCCFQPFLEEEATLCVTYT